MKYFKKLVGTRLYLSPINAEDSKIYTKWLNDFGVSGHIGNFRQNMGLNNEQKMLEQMASAGQNFAIVLINDDILIGNIGLLNIDNINRTAAIGLFFIGESENRGKGYGSEALQLVLAYGFKTLNIHNIMLRVHSDNEQGIACYKKVGFREFGRRHDSEFKDGKYIDSVHMEILDTDFYHIQ